MSTDIRTRGYLLIYMKQNNLKWKSVLSIMLALLLVATSCTALGLTVNEAYAADAADGTTSGNGYYYEELGEDLYCFPDQWIGGEGVNRTLLEFDQTEEGEEGAADSADQAKNAPPEVGLNREGLWKDLQSGELPEFTEGESSSKNNDSELAGEEPEGLEDPQSSNEQNENEAQEEQATGNETDPEDQDEGIEVGTDEGENTDGGLSEEDLEPVMTDVMAIPVILSDIVLTGREVPLNMTNIVLTDRNGNTLTEPISINQDVRVEYYFDLGADAKAGDVSYIAIPNEVKLAVDNFTFNLMIEGSSQPAIIATYQKDEHRLELVYQIDLYQDEVFDLYIYFDGGFDEDQIDGSGEKTIVLGVDSEGNPIKVTVMVDDKTISVDKSGTSLIYMEKDQNEYVIRWTLVINEEGEKVSNLKVEDILPAGTDYIAGSLTCNPTSALDDWTPDYDSETRLLTITNSGEISGKQTLTFLSRITDFEQLSVRYQNNSLYYTADNEVTLLYTNDSGEKTAGDQSSVSVTPEVMYKGSSYNYDTKTILWELVINQDELTIRNAKLTDTLPAGLILDSNDIQIYKRNSSGGYDELTGDALYDVVNIITVTGDVNDGYELVVNFTDPLDACYKIEYSTSVHEDFFEKNNETVFNNSATLTGGFGSGLPGNWSITVPARVYSTMINKSNGGYDAKTQEITWHIDLNRNKQVLEQEVTVEDELDPAVVFVDDSLTVSPDNMNYNYDFGSKNGKTLLTVTFPDGLDGIAPRITFRTQVVDFQYLEKNGVKATIPNTAELFYNKDSLGTSTATQEITADVIGKTIADYNYVDRTVTWQIEVNKDTWPILETDSTVTDYLPEGMELVDGSVIYLVTGSEGSTGFMSMPPEAAQGDDTYTYAYDESEQIIVFYLKNLNRKAVTIQFTAQVTDEYLETEFITNGTKDFLNKAGLYLAQFKDNVTAESNFEMKNSVVSKSGQYDSEEGYIEWLVVINSNALDLELSGATVKDTLQEGLELDTGSVRLTKHELLPGGNYGAVIEDIPLDGSNISYKYDTREFTFTFPQNIDEEYIYLLSFNTDVLESGNYSNSVTFTGKVSESDDSDWIVADVSGGGGGINIKNNKTNLTLLKKDGETGAVMKGVGFTVLDQYGNEIRSVQTTGIDGETVFERLSYNTEYQLVEVRTDEGYVPLSGPVVFTIVKDGDDITVETADDPNVTFTVMESAVQVEIKNYNTELTIIKTDMDSCEPLDGVEFSLWKAETYKEGSEPDYRGTTVNGRIIFKGLAIGTEYVLRETLTLDGYVLIRDEMRIKLVFNRDGQVLLQVTDSTGCEIDKPWITVSEEEICIEIENEKTKVILIKTGEEERLLPGAVFRILDSEGNQIHEGATADPDGTLVLEGLKYGELYTVVEVQAPAGYVERNDFTIMLLEEEPTEAIPDLSEKTVLIVINDEVNCEEICITNDLTRIIIEKVRSGSPDTKLSGAVFEIYDGEELLGELEPTDENGLIEVVGLEYDKVYTLVETRAPSGYRIGEPVRIMLVREGDETHVDEDGVVVLPANLETLEVPSAVVIENRRRSTGGGGGNNPGGENPGGENPGGENPGGENPGGENPGGENPGGENPGGENPGGENPGGENPGGENPGGENPGGENPGGENPGGENPGGENPGGENPGGENPGGENPGGENPGGENPGGNGGHQPGNGSDDTPKTGVPSRISYVISLLILLLSSGWMVLVSRKKE